MRLYDDVLRQIRSLLPAEPTKRAAYDPAKCAPEGEKDRILFRDDEIGTGD